MKYKIGDYLYAVDYTTPRSLCSECNNSGKVEVTYKGEIISANCPKCKGGGATYKKIYHINSRKIYAIQEDDEGIQVAIDFDDECGHWDYKKPEDIGYDTIEEAELEVKKLNAEQKK